MRKGIVNRKHAELTKDREVILDRWPLPVSRFCFTLKFRRKACSALVTVQGIMGNFVELLWSAAELFSAGKKGRALQKAKSNLNLWQRATLRLELRACLPHRSTTEAKPGARFIYLSRRLQVSLWRVWGLFPSQLTAIYCRALDAASLLVAAQEDPNCAVKNVCSRCWKKAAVCFGEQRHHLFRLRCLISICRSAD